MELFIFGRFHARPGDERAVEEALRNVVAPSRKEAGCLSILQPLIDHPLDVTRANLLE